MLDYAIRSRPRLWPRLWRGVLAFLLQKLQKELKFKRPLLDDVKVVLVAAATQRVVTAQLHRLRFECLLVELGLLAREEANMSM